MSFKIFNVRKNVYHIQDSNVFCTLIQGKTLAVLIDTGYGKENIRDFIEKMICTPYIVVNTHGHPDHIGGNFLFDCVYALKEEWDVIFHNQPVLNYELKELQVGEILDLGELHLEVISFPGHTKGSIGFLLKEERLLFSGDAFNDQLWLFNYGSLTLDDLYKSIQKALALDFDTYLFGHSPKENKKEKLYLHLKNIEQLQIENCVPHKLFGFDTVLSTYENEFGKSEIIFTKDKLGILEKK